MALDGFRFLRGEELLTKYRLPEGKYFAHWFCSVCDSTMPRFDEARGIGIVPMDAFDDDRALASTGIFTLHLNSILYASAPQRPVLGRSTIPAAALATFSVYFIRGIAVHAPQPMRHRGLLGGPRETGRHQQTRGVPASACHEPGRNAELSY